MLALFAVLFWISIVTVALCNITVLASPARRATTPVPIWINHDMTCASTWIDFVFRCTSGEIAAGFTSNATTKFRTAANGPGSGRGSVRNTDPLQNGFNGATQPTQTTMEMDRCGIRGVQVLRTARMHHPPLIQLVINPLNYVLEYRSRFFAEVDEPGISKHSQDI
jgi:hypothetical protein